MAVQIVGPEVDACVSALHRAGLELREHAEDGNGKAFLLEGNTFANKELLRRYGGRWSRTRQAWLFDSLEPIRDLASALPPTGEVPSVGLADAPAAFEPATPSFVTRVPTRFKCFRFVSPANSFSPSSVTPVPRRASSRNSL